MSNSVTKPHLIFTLLLIQIILFFNLTSSVKYDCNPNELCKKFSTNTKVINPSDCYSYYLCFKDAQGNMFPSDNPFKCEDGYYFGDGLCRAGTCENTCLNLCRTECTDYNFERVANLKDCSSFYLCLPGGKRERHQCSDLKPYFDGYQCSDNKFGCCQSSTECTAYCEVKNTQIADPYDCRSYYICSDVGAPSIEERYACKEGEYFDKNLGSCETESLLEICNPNCITNGTTDS